MVVRKTRADAIRETLEPLTKARQAAEAPYYGTAEPPAEPAPAPAQRRRPYDTAPERPSWLPPGRPTGTAAAYRKIMDRREREAQEARDREEEQKKRKQDDLESKRRFAQRQEEEAGARVTSLTLERERLENELSGVANQLYRDREYTGGLKGMELIAHVGCMRKTFGAACDLAERLDDLGVRIARAQARCALAAYNADHPAGADTLLRHKLELAIAHADPLDGRLRETAGKFLANAGLPTTRNAALREIVGERVGLAYNVAMHDVGLDNM